MKLNDKCKDWTLEYLGPDSVHEYSEEEEELLKAILHVSGDAVAVIANIKEQKVRNDLLFAFHTLAVLFRDNLQETLEEFMAMQTVMTPLDGIFQPEKIYGKDIRAELFLYLTDEEKEIAIDSFPDIFIQEDMDDDNDLGEEGEAYES
jgi:hypothetical protein